MQKLTRVCVCVCNKREFGLSMRACWPILAITLPLMLGECVYVSVCVFECLYICVYVRVPLCVCMHARMYVNKQWVPLAAMLVYFLAEPACPVHSPVAATTKF